MQPAVAAAPTADATVPVCCACEPPVNEARPKPFFLGSSFFSVFAGSPPPARPLAPSDTEAIIAAGLTSKVIADV